MCGPDMRTSWDVDGSPIEEMFDGAFSNEASYVPQHIPDQFKPTKRYDLDYAKLSCWADDGVWIKRISPVEMQHLHVDRFQDTQRAGHQEEEGAFCARLRLHGASFWTLPPRWPDWRLWCSSIECIPPSKRVNFEAGFPSTGGVWVLNATNPEMRYDGGLGRPLFKNNVALKNALTMDERCHVIKELGGVFCQDVQACPEMDRLLAGS